MSIDGGYLYICLTSIYAPYIYGRLANFTFNEGRYRSVLCRKRSGKKVLVAPTEDFLLPKNIFELERANKRF